MKLPIYMKMVDRRTIKVKWWGVIYLYIKYRILGFKNEVEE